MTKSNIQIPKLNIPKTSREQNEKYEAMLTKLESLGIYIRVYSSMFQNIKHPDGKHTYRADASEAQRLLKDDKDLPQELLDRLAYYKPIIDERLKDSE